MVDYLKLTQEQPPLPSTKDYPVRLNQYLERQFRLLHQDLAQAIEDGTIGAPGPEGPLGPAGPIGPVGPDIDESLARHWTGAHQFDVDIFVNNSNINFATTANGVFQGFTWPTTAPITAKIRAGVTPTLFAPTLDNIYDLSYNVNHETGTRDDTGAHAFVKQTEFDYFDGVDHHVEDLLSFTNAAGVSWRPYQFALNITTEEASWTMKPNNDNGGANFVLESNFPQMAFGRDSSVSNPNDACNSVFWYGKDFASSGGSMFAAYKTELYFDQSVSFAASENCANMARLDFSPAGRTTGQTYGYVVPTPLAPGAGTTVAGFIPIRIFDARIDRITDGQALQIDTQTVSNGAQGNLKMNGVGYNKGHLQLGAWHIWDDNAGNLRAKIGTPTFDTDGTVIA